MGHENLANNIVKTLIRLMWAGVGVFIWSRGCRACRPQLASSSCSVEVKKLHAVNKAKKNNSRNEVRKHVSFGCLSCARANTTGQDESEKEKENEGDCVEWQQILL